MINNEGSKKKNTWWKWLLMFIISMTLLYFAFRGVKWDDLVEGIRSCNFWWIGLSMIASILAFVIRGFRWRLIMLPLNKTITRREAYDGVTIGYLTNFALPRAGEFARCGVISSTGKASFESVLGTVVLERSVDLICFFLILLTVILSMWDKIGEFMTTVIWEPTANALPFNAIWFFGSIVLVITILSILMYSRRETLKKNKVFSKIFSILKGLKEGLVSGFKMKDKWLFLLYTILVWTCYWTMSYSTMKAFPQVSDLNGIDAIFLMVVGGLGWIVPVQGGIGAYHFIMSVAVSSIYAIPQTTGVILATISHESQALTMLLCGAISLISISISKKAISLSKK